MLELKFSTSYINDIIELAKMYMAEFEKYIN